MGCVSGCPSEKASPDEWWDVIAACDHAAFDALDSPQRPMEQCPTCQAFLRTITTTQGWAEHWAEERAESAARDKVQARARREDARW